MIYSAVQPYVNLMRLNRPIGTFLLLWPTLIALWLAADGHPDLKTALIFITGVILMRAAGCVINDYADRNFDAYVARTQNRPLARKQIMPRHALYLFALLLSLAFILVLQLSAYTILLSIIAAILAIIYPFCKRFTKYPQFILSLAFAWSIPMVYSQIIGHLNTETWVLFISIMAWVIAYDTQYAMADIADDLKLGIKSTAITFGNYDRITILSLQICTLIGFAFIGIQREFNYGFFSGLIIANSLILYQQFLIKKRDPQQCFKAFLNNNWFGAIIFASILLFI